MEKLAIHVGCARCVPGGIRPGSFAGREFGWVDVSYFCFHFYYYYFFFVQVSKRTDVVLLVLAGFMKREISP